MPNETLQVLLGGKRDMAEVFTIGAALTLTNRRHFGRTGLGTLVV